MRIYRYDLQSLRFLGWFDVDVAEPYQDQPGYVLNEGPPDEPAPEGKAWGYADGAWIALTDNIGQVWHDPDTGVETTLLALGGVVPDGWVQGAAPVLASLADAQAGALTRIDRARERRIAAGMDYTFGVSSDRVQTRPIDLRNLQTIQGTALTLSLTGATGAVIPFRAESNTDYTLTPSEALAMCGAVAAYGTSCYQWAWSLKAAIGAATDVAAVEALLAEAGIQM